MDGANWRPTQGADPAAGAEPNAAAPAGGDWRAQLQPEARSRIVNKIMETMKKHLKKHLPLSVPEGLDELQKIAVRFEEKIYAAATNQSDYLRKIALKMLSMETPKPQGPQQPPGNAQVIPNQNPSGPASLDSTAQTGHAGAGDWQEEIYQMVKSLKDQYFAELSELYNKICVKLQHVDSMIPPQKPSDQYEKMKGFKMMLERTLQVLQINKNHIQPALREKVPAYERQIMSILNAQRMKPVQTQGQQQFQQSAGQAPSSNISQQQQPSQGLPQHDSHTNQMPQASLPSMSTGLQSSSAAGSRPLRWRRGSARMAPTSSPSTRTRRCSISLRSLRVQLRQRPLPPHGALLAVTAVRERRVAGLGEATVLGRLLQRLPQHALLQAPPAARPRPRRRRLQRPVLLVQEQRPSNSRRSSLWRRLHSKRGISVRSVIF